MKAKTTLVLIKFKSHGVCEKAPQDFPLWRLQFYFILFLKCNNFYVSGGGFCFGKAGLP